MKVLIEHFSSAHGAFAPPLDLELNPLCYVDEVTLDWAFRRTLQVIVLLFSGKFSKGKIFTVEYFVHL